LAAAMQVAFVTSAVPAAPVEGARHGRVVQSPQQAVHAGSAVTVTRERNHGAMLCSIAALVLVGGTRRSQQRKASRTVRQAEQRATWETPADKTQVTNAPAGGVEYRSWLHLQRKARHIGNTKRFRQQLTLQKEGIEEYQEWEEGVPLGRFLNMYKGADSHKDNPYFPAPSAGWMELARSKRKAFGLASASSAGSHFGKSGGAVRFAGSSAPMLARGTTCRASIVMKAHKKAASATKHQGRKQKPTHRGVQLKGGHGNAVKVGTVLVKQLGTRWRPGANVTRTKNNDLMAARDGIVQWRGDRKRDLGLKKYMSKGLKEVFVVPWEFVNQHCVFGPDGTLLPKEYEPWMGIRNPSPRGSRWIERFKDDYISSLREQWLETDAGQSWKEKKDEKREKQRAIQARIRAYKKGQAQPEPVSVASDSEGEA